MFTVFASMILFLQSAFSKEKYAIKCTWKITQRLKLFAVISSQIRRASINSFIRRTSAELTAGAVLLTANTRGFLEKHHIIPSV